MVSNGYPLGPLWVVFGAVATTLVDEKIAARIEWPKVMQEIPALPEIANSSRKLPLCSLKNT